MATENSGDRRTVVAAIALAAVLLAVYMINGSPLPGNDTKPARYVAVSLLKRGDLDLDEFAPSFVDQRGGLPYYVIEGEGGHVISRFGPATPIAASPVFALALAAGGGSIDAMAARRWAKLASALYVALTALLLVLIARRLGADLVTAVVVAALFGLGTCAFSVMSQALWQHGPSTFFLTLGLYLLVRDGRLSVPLAGAAFAAMVACRPPNMVFALAATAYVAHARRDRLLWFVAAAAPIAILQGIYNAVYLGAPWRFSQMVQVTGPDASTLPAEYWDGSFFTGLAGLLISPSRGLLVFSPFLLLLAWRPRRAWSEHHLALRYALGGALALILVVASYYGWYGGWSFGYRMIADTAPVLCLALLPGLAWVRGGNVRTIVFAVAALIAVAIHTVGAYAYDPYGWDAAPDVDRNRDRLWSVRDSQLAYWFGHLRLRP